MIAYFGLSKPAIATGSRVKGQLCQRTTIEWKNIDDTLLKQIGHHQHINSWSEQLHMEVMGAVPKPHCTCHYCVTMPVTTASAKRSFLEIKYFKSQL